MQTTINQQQTEEQRVFENDETAKNNDVSRKVEISNVTGYAPDEWVASNNPYLNDDGTIKDEYKDVDFSAVMANAKASGNTKAYNEASVARYYKIMSNYAKYGKYDDGNYSVPGAMKTESARQFDEQTKLSDKELDTTKELTQAELEAQERMNSSDNATTLAKTDKDNATSLAITDKQINSSSGEDEVDWSDFSKIAGISNNDIATRNFITHNLQPMIDEGLNLTKSNDGNDVYYTVIDENGKSTTKSLKDLLINNSSTITKDGAKKIWDSLGLNGVTWVDNYSWYVPDGQNNFTPE
jgi:hypothetical protein